MTKMNRVVALFYDFNENCNSLNGHINDIDDQVRLKARFTDIVTKYLKSAFGDNFIDLDHYRLDNNFRVDGDSLYYILDGKEYQTEDWDVCVISPDSCEPNEYIFRTLVSLNHYSFPFYYISDSAYRHIKAFNNVNQADQKIEQIQVERLNGQKILDEIEAQRAALAGV